MPVPLQYPVLMPDTPADIVTEIGKSRAARRLKEELITGARFQQEFMLLRSARIAEANRIIQSRVMEGNITRIARYDNEFHFQMIREYGPECWGNEDFWEDTLKKNPWMRIRVHRPVRISFDGFGMSSDKTKGTGGNRIAGRTHDPLTMVRGIEHSPVLSPREVTG